METKTKKSIQKPKVKKRLSQKQVLMIGLGGGVALGLGYLVYNHFKNRAATNRGSISDPITIPSEDIVTKPILPIAASGSFPVKRGARGSLVAMIQNALLAKGGQVALIIKETSFRNGQVDGIFGPGTERALRAAGFPSVITESVFTSLVGKIGNSPFGGLGAVAKEIIDAANSRNLFSVLSGLKKIKSVEQYKQVSSFFQGVRINGIRVTTLVNALLSVAFKNKELEKVKIRAEFRRMGLKQNSQGVWYVPNLGSIDAFDRQSDQINNQWNLAIATRPTLLKATDGSIIVPELRLNTVVGYITGIQNGVTRILTQSGETVFAPTQNLTSF